MNTIAANLLPLSPIGRMLTSAWRKLAHVWRGHSCPRALSIRETASLGERRLVAVVHVGSQRFLIGASPSSVTLLAQLPDELYHTGAVS